MKRRIKHFFKSSKESSFFHVGTLVMGSFIAQGISLLLYPLLTRIYSPEEFGFFGKYLGVILVVSAVSTLQFNIGIPIPKEEREAIHLRLLSFLSVFFFSFISLLTILFFGEEISAYYEGNLLFKTPYLYLFPLYIFFIGINETYKYWFIRKKIFVAEAYFQVITRVIANVGKILPLIFIFPKLVLVFLGAEITSQILATGFWKTFYFKELKTSNISSLKAMKNTIKKYKDIPTAQTLTNFLEIALEYFPFVILSHYLEIQDVGYLLITQKLVIQPCMIISRSISNVFLEKFSRGREGKQENIHLFLKLCKYTVLMGGLLYSVIWGVSCIDLSLFFGEKWGGLSPILLTYGAIVLTRLSAYPLNKIFLIYKKTKYYTSIKLTHLGMNLALVKVLSSSFHNHLSLLLIVYVGIEIFFDMVTIVGAWYIVKKNSISKKRVFFLHGVNASWVNKDGEMLRKEYLVSDCLLERESYIKTIFHKIEAFIISDIIYCWFGSILFLPFIVLGRIFGKKIVIVAGGYDVAKTKKFPHGYFDKNLFFQWGAKILFSLAHKVLCVSKSTLKEAQDNAQIPLKKLELIPLGFKAYKGELLERERPPVMTMISSMDSLRYELKGGDLFCELASEMPHYQFQIMGSLTEDVKKKIERLKIKNLTLLGSIEFNSPKFNEILLKSRFIVQLSYYESFGAALVDGAIRGCCPIATNSYALSELVKEVGIGVTHGDIQCIINQVSLFEANPISPIELSEYYVKRYPLARRRESLLLALEKLSS